MVRLLTLLVAMFCASPAASGAWLREESRGFSTVTGSLAATGAVYQSSYLEFGVRNDLTLGAETGFSALATGVQSGFATVFLRRPIGHRDRPSVWAYELGMGAAWTGELVNPYLVTGLSWGRGYQLKGFDGWVSVDTSLNWDVYYADHQIKIDSTIGLNFNNRFSGMVQIFGAGNKTGHATSLAPSFVIKPLKNHPGLSLQIGGRTQLGNPANSAIRISVWREF